MNTVKMAAEKLGVSVTLVYALCAAKMIRHERHGLGRGTIRISDEALEEYRKRRMVGPEEKKTSPTPESLPGNPFTMLDGERLAQAWLAERR